MNHNQQQYYKMLFISEFVNSLEGIDPELVKEAGLSHWLGTGLLSLILGAAPMTLAGLATKKVVENQMPYPKSTLSERAENVFNLIDEQGYPPIADLPEETRQNLTKENLQNMADYREFSGDLNTRGVSKGRKDMAKQVIEEINRKRKEEALSNIGLYGNKKWGELPSELYNLQHKDLAPKKPEGKPSILNKILNWMR